MTSNEITSAAREVMNLYPRIFFACHERHMRDPKTKQLVSEHQANILQHLDETHSISTSALAGHMDVTISTMSLAVSRLAKLGYVRHKRDASDTRRVMLRLTRAGRVCVTRSPCSRRIVLRNWWRLCRSQIAPKPSTACDCLPTRRLRLVSHGSRVALPRLPNRFRDGRQIDEAKGK